MILGAENCRRAQLYAELAYRVLYYVLVTSPLWGAVLALSIVWQRLDF